MSERQRVVVLGGGPGGYEAALVAAQLGAAVTVVERDGLGGAAVLTDVVPSKTLIATAEVMALVGESVELGVRFPGPSRPDGGRSPASGDPASSDPASSDPDGSDPDGDSERDPAGAVSVDLGAVNRRVRALARAQSDDVQARLESEGVRVVRGRGRLDGPSCVAVSAGGDAASDDPAGDGAAGRGTDERLAADTVLVATGSRPRELPDALPDGERILTWKQLYGLDELPERLVVVGSGVTGAEFANAYNALGADVVLVSSRDRVLPGEDADAAEVLEAVFRRRGMQVLSRSRAQQVKRASDGVVITLTDGRTIEGSHCLMAVGSIPNTEGTGLAEAGVRLTPSGHVEVDGVSRTTVRGVYAAGDCTGILPLASVAAMQGRIAMWHSLGDAVAPIDLHRVSSNVFTAPEIATVGVSHADVEAGRVPGVVVKLPLATNARAKMQGVRDGFVKLVCAPGSGWVLGGVVVAPRASELIFPIAIAVTHRLTVDDVAQAFTVYPSLSGSVAEAARRLHRS